ncbi:MAG: metallophosphoesterase family protein [Dehalococcoidia bacterium]
MTTTETTNRTAPQEPLRSDAQRIALISDTHFMAEDGSDVPQPLLDALAGVELILHLGHVSSAAGLNRLESVAPVIAVQTDLDNKLMGEHLAAEVSGGRTAGYTRILEAGGLRVGLVHDFSVRGVEVPLVEENDAQRLAFPDASMAEILTSKFGAPVDIVAFAATHQPMVLHRQGVLLVNPGSPNLPSGRRKGGARTLAVLNLRDGVAEVEIIELGGQ